MRPCPMASRRRAQRWHRWTNSSRRTSCPCIAAPRSSSPTTTTSSTTSSHSPARRRSTSGAFRKGSSKSVVFDKSGTVQVFCHIHSDMSAVMLVLDNPYFAVPSDCGQVCHRRSAARRLHRGGMARADQAGDADGARDGRRNRSARLQHPDSARRCREALMMPR